MDQTPLGFVLDDSKTYDKKGAEEEWIASGQSVKTGAINFQILIPQGQLKRSCLLIYTVKNCYIRIRQF